MRVVVLTNSGSSFGGHVLAALKAADVPVGAIVVINQGLGYYVKLFKYVRRSVGLVDAVFFSVKRVLGAFVNKWQPTDDPLVYETFCDVVERTTATNAPETVRIVSELKPDFVILGQTGIVGRRLLAIPAVGTLNAHPAILPDYRGIDCAKWALLNDDLDKIGSTVHWVNSGVDTGNVISKLRYAVTLKDTVEHIDEALSRQCANQMAGVVRRLLNGEKLPGERQSAEEGNQYRKMSWRQEKSAKAILEKLIRQTI